MIGESYPWAHEHLRSALDAKSKLSTRWSDLLEDEILDQGLVMEADGTGCLTVYSTWPYNAQEELTQLFRDFVDELWACLDTLVAESTVIFSVQQRLRASERPRFFPIADSQAALEELLAESCLGGVLATQAQMIIDCQPFRDEPDDERVQLFRKGLKQLLAWTHSLEEGVQVGAWATPVEPQVFVPAPARLADLRPAEPGELLDVLEVVHFQVDGYTEQIDVSGAAGTYIDLGFPDGYIPTSPEDTFDERVEAVLDGFEQELTDFIVVDVDRRRASFLGQPFESLRHLGKLDPAAVKASDELIDQYGSGFSRCECQDCRLQLTVFSVG